MTEAMRSTCTAPEWLDSSHRVRLPLYDFGGHGPTLLVAHATGFHGRVYQPLLAHLRLFHSYSIDLRGHGDSVVERDHDYEWQGFAKDLAAAVEHLRQQQTTPQPLFGFGHSMGAAALLMVEQMTPGSFAGLFCYEPVVHPTRHDDRGPDDDDQRLHGWIERTRKRRTVFSSKEQALANYQTKAPYESFDSRALDAYVGHGFSVDDSGSLHLKCRPEVEAQIYRMGPRHRTFAALGEIRCPVLLARGSVVQQGPSLWAEEIAAQIPGCQFEVFEGLGHLGPLEDPDTIGRRVASYFESL